LCSQLINDFRTIKPKKVILLEKGVRRVFWVPTDLDNLIENVRRKLGMSKSTFYRYAILRLLEDMSVLSTKAKEDMIDQEGFRETHLNSTSNFSKEGMKHE